jgi:hypothetical protein
MLARQMQASQVMTERREAAIRRGVKALRLIAEAIPVRATRMVAAHYRPSERVLSQFNRSGMNETGEGN